MLSETVKFVLSAALLSVVVAWGILLSVTVRETDDEPLVERDEELDGAPENE